MGKKEEGVAELRACLNFQPKYCQGWRELGRIQLADGQAKEAVGSFEQYARDLRQVGRRPAAPRPARSSGPAQAGRARESFQRCAELGEGTPVGEDCRKSGEQLR